MARVNLYVPDELLATVRDALPDLNASAVLQDGLRARLVCTHDELACRRCALPITRAAVSEPRIGEFWFDLWWALDGLIARGGTAEGAARVARDVGRRHQITAALRAPLPRPTRAERRRNTVAELPLEADSRERHPTARRTA